MQIERVGRHGNSQIYDSLGESSLARGSYIEHRVSKWDTLAGVAIMYGVEVADIKRLNGLVTDRQMFALKSLQIPLPGRHPPSPVLGKNSTSSGESNSEQTTPACRDHIDILELLQSLKLKPSQKKVSSAMSTLQGYYGLASDSRGAAEGTEMAVYREGFVQYLDTEKLPKASPVSDPPQTWHCKSRSLVSSVSSENGESIDDLPSSEAGDIDSENSNNIPVRRRQKDDAGQNSPTPELIIKEDKTSGGYSGKTGKGLVLRPKLASWFTLATDSESSLQNPGPNGNSAFLSDMFACVRKSSSTSNLHGSDGSSTIWPTSKWSLKPDLQALSTPTTRRLIFDGLPKPITGWRSKAAVD